MQTADEMFVRAQELRKQADDLSKQAVEVRRAELAAKPLLERLVFAAHARCDCGAGLAYDPAGQSEANSPFRGPSRWECSAILLFKETPPEEQEKTKVAMHTAPPPFAFYEIKSENQPSANGATTRPRASTEEGSDA